MFIRHSTRRFLRSRRIGMLHWSRPSSSSSSSSASASSPSSSSAASATASSDSAATQEATKPTKITSEERDDGEFRIGSMSSFGVVDPFEAGAAHANSPATGMTSASATPSSASATAAVASAAVAAAAMDDPRRASAAAAAAAVDAYPPSVSQAQLNVYARKDQTAVSLQQMAALAAHPTSQNLLASAKFLYKELPIRFSKRIRDLESLPYGLSEIAAVRMVQQLYVRSVSKIVASGEPSTVQHEKDFTDLLKRILYHNHRRGLLLVAQGVMDWKRQHLYSALENKPTPLAPETPVFDDEREQQDVKNLNYMDEVTREVFVIDEFLDRFYTARLGLRLLMAQHIATHYHRDGLHGIIDPNCRVMDMAQYAADEAAKVCVEKYGVAPKVTMHGKKDLTFRYVPGHIRLILFEIFKNSMRATVEEHMLKRQSKNPGAAPVTSDDLPPVQVVFADGAEDICIKVADRGGGISRLDMSNVWSHLYSTADTPSFDEVAAYAEATRDRSSSMLQENMHGWASRVGVGAILPAPMAGLGYGLPVSRLYARYFGGDLKLYSMHGFGTDAFLYLNKLGTSMEALPSENSYGAFLHEKIKQNAAFDN